MKIVLRMTGKHHLQLMEHLFPGDGNEAVAIALCGRRRGSERHILTVQQVYPVPYSDCRVRTAARVEWATEMLLPIIGKAVAAGLALIKIHSHPGGYREFSELDHASDRDLFQSVYGWMETDEPHASLVMLPDGELFGRVVGPHGEFTAVDLISVIGDDISFWHSGTNSLRDPVSERTEQAFGSKTVNVLKNLSIAVIGCSGTGSLVIEQLHRLQTGWLDMVDPEKVEERNLNRIPNATKLDAERERLKVEVLAEAICRTNIGTIPHPIARNLIDPEVVKAVAGCDVLFGCMDTIEGRHYLNLVATFYCLPYFDLGVKLEADGVGGVSQVCGTVHYLQPGGSSLLSRGVYTLEQLRAEGLRRTNPTLYEEQVKSKYIIGVQEDRPAVISVNMLVSSLAVNELLARLHKYRNDDNANFASTRVSLTDGFVLFEPDGAPDLVLARNVGRGDIDPLLDRVELSESSE